MKKDYYVQVPIAGMISLCVRAENKEEAKELAMNGAGYFSLKVDESETLPENIDEGYVEWEPYERLTSGNVNYFWHNEIEVEEE